MIKEDIDNAIQNFDNTKIVDPTLLNKVRLDDNSFDFRYSIAVEKQIQDVMCAHLNNNGFNLVKGIITDRFNSDFDFKINDVKLELKISTKTTPFFELCRVDKHNNVIKESGLWVTKSDYYLCLNPADIKNGVPHSMKLRIFPTKHLIRYSEKEDFTLNTYGKNEGSNGRPCGFYLDWNTWNTKYRSEYFVMGFEFETYPKFNLTQIITTTSPSFVYRELKNIFK